MKMICLEEHAVDGAITKAAQPRLAAEASYMADWGSRVHDRGVVVGEARPALQSMATAIPLAADLGAGRIAEMDAHGIDMQIISYSSPLQLAPADQAVDLARAANDRLAEAVRLHPTRFGGFAALPWQDPEAAARELERAVTSLALRGTLLVGRPGDTFLDDERYAPVLAKLDELRVPIYVHPGAPLPAVRDRYYAGFDDEVSARLSLFGWGWHHEAGIQVVRMMLAGVFERHPGLQVISGHWGEMVPFYLQRLDDTIPQEATRLSRSISETYRSHVYVTPSGMLNVPHFEFIHKVMGVDRILYSVDYPYLSNTGARRFLEDAPFSREDREKIAHTNTEGLLRLER